MIEALLREPMFWGAGGAFIYAAPRLSVCIATALARKTGCITCTVDAILALAIGVISAAAFTDLAHALAVKFIGDTIPKDGRAISCVLGLLANPLAPRLVDVAGGRLIKKLESIVGTDKTP